LITWALVKSVILTLTGERREENLEKETVASLHEYKLDAGDVEKSLRKIKGALVMALLCWRKPKVNRHHLQPWQLQWLL
jgi:hypothetical protein